MSKPQVQATITAHPSHFFDVFSAILRAFEAGHSILANAKVIPAGKIEDGIQIATVLAEVGEQTAEQIAAAKAAAAAGQQ